MSINDTSINNKLDDEMIYSVWRLLWIGFSDIGWGARARKSSRMTDFPMILLFAVGRDETHCWCFLIIDFASPANSKKLLCSAREHRSVNSCEALVVVLASFRGRNWFLLRRSITTRMSRSLANCLLPSPPPPLNARRFAQQPSREEERLKEKEKLLIE